MAKIAKLVAGLSGEAKERALFTLGSLQKLGNAHLDEFTTEMNTLPDGPIGTVKVKAHTLNTVQRCYFAVKEQPDDTLNNIINGLLGESDDGFKKVIGNLLKGALNSLLGNVAVADNKDRESYVTIGGPGIILRIDVLLWRYQFDSHGLTAEAQNAFVYGFNSAVVDPAEVPEYMLRYLVWKMISADTTIPADKKKEEFDKLWKKFKPEGRDGEGELQRARERHKRLNTLTAKVNAKVHDPSGMAVGNEFIYFACPTEGKIWRVDPSLYEPEVAAGGGTSTEDDVEPTQAKLAKPTDVAVDDRGDYLIADYGAARVRLVKVGENKITTVFDGTKSPGSEDDPIRPAHINGQPSRGFHVVAYQEGDKAAPLRFVDIDKQYNAIVVKQSDLKLPNGIAKLSPEVHGVVTLDDSLTKLVAFSGNGFVGSIPWGGTEVTRVYGGGEEISDNVPAKDLKLRYPCGLTYDSSTGYLYIAEGHGGVPPYHSRVRRINTKTGSATSVASGPNVHAADYHGGHEQIYTLSDSRDSDARVFRAHIQPVHLK
ncbi:hypothetical protein [Streptomyces sp. NPDC018045]|uniref:hypothetical protein n=1 Tax=Streptomyces sp. NPDC018045 TaxID=3365037 RepID=UPI00379033D2